MASAGSECTVRTSSFSFWSAITRRKHDVFLSFRGEDTRHNVLPRVHQALVDAGIPTFKDDISLEKGCDIASELLKAIQMSSVAVIIFSRNYATSGWCLDELVKIVECKKEDGQVILPLFVDVDPCDVVQQKGSFEVALKDQEARMEAQGLAAEAGRKLKQLRSEILQKDDLEIDNVKDGATMIEKEMSSKRVFVVLDNVNKVDHLNALARKRKWFCPGSRIIITTRDDELLNVLEVDQIIEERCRENLQMIEDLLRLMHRSHIEADKRVESLIDQIENERRKNATLSGCPLEALISSSNVDTTSDSLLDGFDLDDEYEAQGMQTQDTVISLLAETDAASRKNNNQSLTVNPLIPTKEANMSSREVQGGAKHGAMLNIEPEKEIINGDGALDDKEALTKHLESTRRHLAHTLLSTSNKVKALNCS
ncbi:hypothetical protein RJ640_024123 [Escallonia rubra]|uniref:TIR domain-containing protein n=1 Tax=Escallonia rubra TaxID=112253 RepID=A0AA88QNN6_9ASTE|nr:hypothetical protein RJ640_024123 [Escallonia rubra]